jgi:hypothetical protein
METPESPPLETLKRLQRQHAEKARAAGRATVTPIKKRMIESSVEISAKLADDILFQHTVFCQTVLPYRDPGPEVREWKREQGDVRLLLEAGKAYNKKKDAFVEIGLPFGPAARLILCHLNTEALRTGVPAVEVAGSMTAFIRRLQGYQPNGQEIGKFKDQLTRLSTSLIRLALRRDDHALQIDTKIITGFDLWVERFEGEQFMFPQVIKLGADYFTSLQEHAIPLDERAVAALAHSAMALDVYTWLAQRLHRVDPKRGQFIPWTALHQQFGQGYKLIRQFRSALLGVLKMVKTQYPAARFGIDQGGMMLGNSPPPVQRRTVLGDNPLPSPTPPLAIPNAQMLSLPKPPPKA